MHNEFIGERKLFFQNKARMHNAAFRIQNRWKNACVNPYCILGEKHYKEYINDLTALNKI